MSKFKVGDRVVVAVSYEGKNMIGKKGTVCEESHCPWVSFDEPTRYGGGFGEKCTKLPFAKIGHMDCLNENDLELLPVTLTVDAAIAAYNLACEAFEAKQLELEKAKSDVRDARLALRDALDGET